MFCTAGQRAPLVAGIVLGWFAASASADDLEEFIALNQKFNAEVSAGRHQKAEPLGRQIVETAERLFADQPAVIASAVNNLAIVCYRQNHYADALPLYKRAIALWDGIPGNAQRVIVCLIDLGKVHQAQRQFAEAEACYRQALALREEAVGPEHALLVPTLNSLTNLYMIQDRYFDAAKPAERALAIREKAREPRGLAESLDNLALVYDHEGRLADAEDLYRRALAIREQELGRTHSDVARVLNHLGILLYKQGRFAEAEPIHQRARAIFAKLPEQERFEEMLSLHNLANLYRDQARYAEAETYYGRERQVLAKYGIDGDHPAMATHLHELANLYLMQQRYADAKPCYQRALEVLERLGLNDTLEIADNLDALGILHEEQGDVSAAEPLLMRAFKIRETVLGDQHPRVAMSCTNLSVLRRAMGDHASAQSLARRAMSIYESCLAGPTAMFEPTFILADAEWAQGRRDAALTELDRALDMAESERRGASGGEQELGRLFSQLLFAFERMIAWQAELGHTAEAVLALERGRARSLVDQLATQQIDLLADVPHSEARELRDRDAAAQRQVVALERQLEVAAMRTDLSDADLRTMQRELEKQLTRARAEIVAVYRDIRNASPAYRQAVGQDYRPLPLPDIQAWVAEQNGALLEYVIGVESSHVFVIPPAGEARVERLTLNDERAKALGVEPGDLTSAKLATTWQLGTGDLGDALTNPHTAARDGGDHDSADQISCDRGLTLVTEALARPASAAATTARLALLWQILIPPSAQAVVTSATCQRLFVVPDGLLATLPFEVLVVEAGPQPKYFLDVSPPIVYAPSATVLVNLAGQSTKATKSAPQPVLTVANPTYRGRPQETDPTLLASTPRTRFWSSVGQLQPLPYTDQESKWVVDVFKQRGIKSGALRDRSATEVGARLNVPGREIIHFACHGLVDQMHGNFFGALALTPGKSNAGATDDGFLTLAEIYGLPLDGCELAILSACQTNLGLQQRGEGLYGLSRGFLVAGARRVVASNWLVDDEAAATLVSVFCSAIAKSKEQKLPVDYAAALHAAKRRIRQNERWQSPFYWGTFVLIGPP